MEEQGTYLERHILDMRRILKRQERVSMTCPMPPSLNRMQRAVNGRIVDSRLYREYKASFARRVTDKNPHLITLPDDIYAVDGVYLVVAAFYFERIRKKNRGGGPSPYLKLDADNRVKPLLDCIRDFTGIDDANFFFSAVEKDVDPDDPRVEVEIWRVM